VRTAGNQICISCLKKSPILFSIILQDLIDDQKSWNSSYLGKISTQWRIYNRAAKNKLTAITVKPDN